ncbi:hypothetical protein JCM21900_005307 [Sporobolomyces salmonicolor]
MRLSLVLPVLSLLSLASSQPSPQAVPTAPPSAPLVEQANLDLDLQQRALIARQATSARSSGSSISIPGTAPAGGLTYVTPAGTAAVSYYKIASGNPITFGWNYTSLYVTPSSLTFEAICTANGYTYPVTTIAAAETSLVWDPWQYAQSPNALPFAQASYTLRVFDERGIQATAQAGLFNGANSIVNFALYSPAAYTPLADGWTCTGCSFASVSQHLSHPLVVAIPVTAALVLIGGAGVFGR